MTMKLYTEEQVKSAMLSSYLEGVTRPPFYEEVEKSIFYSLTPIELPSDEEIEEVSDTRLLYTNDNSANFRLGAKWIKEQIHNQNK